MLITNCLFLLFILMQKSSVADEHFDYWTGVGQNILRKQLLVDVGQKPLSRNIFSKKATNVILVIGSGLSMPTIRAAEWYQKQKYGSGVYFDNFPIVGFANTFCSRAPVVNGECVGTSFLTKSDGKISKDVIESIAQWAVDSGKDVGIVTTSKLTSPQISPMYGQKDNIEWESDVDVPKNKTDDGSCQDMACQLLLSNPGKRFKVILGGGMKNFVSNNTETFRGSFGRRLDGRNIINEWIDDKKKKKSIYKFVENRKDLLQKDKGIEYLLGIFNSDDMEFHLKSDHEEKPSLSEMTRAALTLLSRNEKGYFLFVYDGTIDVAHRKNSAHLAFEQVAQLSSTVETLDKSTNPENTLLILTADHGSTMTMSGYPFTHDDILKTTIKKGLNYSILTYGNGPGYRTVVDGSDIKDDVDFKYLSLAPLDRGTHGGESVAVYARGPWQEIFAGTYNLDLVPHAVGYAASMGPGKKCCERPLLRSTSGGSFKMSYGLFVEMVIVASLLFNNMINC